jgi:hypothetical protein
MVDRTTAYSILMLSDDKDEFPDTASYITNSITGYRIKKR